MPKNQHLTMHELTAARVNRNRLNDGRKIRDDEGARRFIDERGFVLLMPITGVPLPSISEADSAKPWPGFEITDRAWAWKETLPGARHCAYTKLIHGRGTFISWRMYPSFLKTYGPDGDLDHEYESGRLGKAACDLCRIIEAYGPIDSRELWRKAKPLFGEKRSRFSAALEKLQSRFLVTVAGGSTEGWSLHTWDTVERQVPTVILDKLPTAEEAGEEILLQTIQNCVAVSELILRRILHWQPDVVKRHFESLKGKGLIDEVTVGENESMWEVMKSREK